MRKIDLVFNEEEIDDIFEKTGMKRENITAYYKDFDIESDDMHHIPIEIAYPDGNKPKELCVEFPDAYAARKYSVENAVSDIIKNKIISLF